MHNGVARMPIQHDSTVAAEATSTNQMATILKLTYREKKENETPKKKHIHTQCGILHHGLTVAGILLARRWLPRR
jgi:hypothetical protein